MADYETKTEGDDADDTKPTKPEAKSLTDSANAARRIQTELDASKRWLEKFTTEARRCETAYMGQTNNDDSSGSDPLRMDQRGKVNLFWSNVQVVLSAIYAKLPQAEVDRKFNDYTDDVSRVAGIIMQRVLNSDIAREHDDTNAAMRDAVQDRFIVGLGQVWCRYEVETEVVEEPLTDPLTGQPAVDEFGQVQTQPTEKIVNEDAPVDFVHWDDFRFSPCRRWRENRWVARRLFMSEPKLKKRFNLSDEQCGMVPMTTRLPDGSDSLAGENSVLRATPFKQAAVWEFWDKAHNCVYWYVEGCSFVLDQVPDPLELEDFFPCPQPVVATTLTNAFRPRADYTMARDLYRELDRINARISSLTRAVKVTGVYDKAAPPVKSMLTTAVENALVPVDNWSVFAEKGGLKGSVDFMPIEQYAAAIMQLTQRKAQCERDLYEVLGISDLMRGATLASETATAQQLKAQFGGARLSSIQNEVARFVSGVMQIRANIIANHFQPETLVKRSLIDRTPDAQYAPQAIQLLKDYGTSLYSISVTADTLSAPDWAAEKEARTEFLGAASNYIMSAAPIVQQSPQVGSFLIKLLQWGAAGFKGGKSIEGVLDEAARSLEQQAQQPPAPPQPTAEDEKNKAQAAKYAAETDKTKADTAKTAVETQVIAQQNGIPIPAAMLPQPPMPQGMPGPGGPMPPQGPPQGMPQPANALPM